MRAVFLLLCAGVLAEPARFFLAPLPPPSVTPAFVPVPAAGPAAGADFLASALPAAPAATLGQGPVVFCLAFLAGAAVALRSPVASLHVAGRPQLAAQPAAQRVFRRRTRAPRGQDQSLPNLGEGNSIDSAETYNFMLTTMLKAETKDLKVEISKNYLLIDYAFMQKLDKSLAEEQDQEKLTRLTEIKEAVNTEMASRMQQAAEALKDIVQSPTPVVMEGKIAGLARQGRVDDALLQLIQANVEQAREAGEQGKGAVQVLSKLQERVKSEFDKKLEPEAALLRRLLRMDDPEARRALLREQMAPKKGVSKLDLSAVSTEQRDSATSTEPDVPPRKMAAAIREIKARFGNVDEQYDTGFIKRLEDIAEEAESTALDLAGGKELTSKQAQDLAWERSTVSVWDLGQVEEEAHQEGKMAVWEEEAQAQMARQDEAMRQKAIDTDWAQK